MATSSMTIGQYRIVELIGQGGMATVYKAYHARLDRIVAIKMIHKQHLDDVGFVARFEREAQLVARLEHPHIVPVYDYDEFDGQPYLVMKYIEGTTLKAVLAEGALKVADTLHVLNAVASALDYAHGRGILHRDIKPSNIMIDMQAVPYLADFGLARTAQGGASTISMDMLIGTPFYMSPEQARGDADIDHRADIYSFGIVVYELLTGRVPFNGATPYSIIHMQVSAELPAPRSINPDLPPAAEAVLLKALAKDRRQRYDSAGALMAELTTALADMHDVAVPSPAQPLALAVASASQRKPAAPSRPPVPAAVSARDHRVQEAKPAAPISPHRRRWLNWVMGLLAIAFVLFALMVIANRARRQAQEPIPTLASLPGQPPNDLIPVTLGLYEVPVLAIDEADALAASQPDDPTAHLARYRAYLEAERLDELAAILVEGLPHADNAALYLLTAAGLAHTAGEDPAALLILRDGLTRLQNDSTYPLYREHAGNALYQAALSPRAVDLFQVRELRAANLIALRTRTPLDVALSARALLSFDRTSTLAASLVESALRRSPGLPEALLIQGEIAAERGDLRDAQRSWQAARDTESAPDWVQRRAESLLSQTGA